jgi:PAS domain S-box-containing protein
MKRSQRRRAGRQSPPKALAAETILRDSEARFRLAVETANLGTYERDIVTNQLTINDACRRILGIPAGETPPPDVAPRSVYPEDRDRVLAAVTRAFDPDIREICSAEFRILRPDGTVCWVAGRGRVHFDDQAQPPRPSKFQGVLLDITERKKAEQALERRTLCLQLLHHAAARLLLGQQPMDLLRELHPQITQTFGADVFMLYQPDAPSGRLRLQACAGVTPEEQRTFERLRYGCAICTPPAGTLKPIIATQIQSGEVSNRRLVRRLGFRSYLYYPLILDNRLQGTLAFASRRRDSYDDIDQDFFHTIANTIAEALERQRLESELHRHASHLEQLVNQRTARLRETIADLEGFSYSLVHDLRAPLRAMHAFATLIEEDSAARLGPQAQDHLRKIKLASNRMDQLITDSLNYSKILHQDLPLVPVNLGSLLRGLVETYPNLQAARANIRLEIDDLRVLGNEAALTQIFANLLDNAVKFVAHGVTPRVRVWAEPAPNASPAASSLAPSGEDPLREQAPHPSRATQHPDDQREQPASPPSTLNRQPSTPPFRYVCIWIEDNGIGIPTHAQEKIFGIFQRMHRADEYPGTGIGLAIVRKSLDRIGGQVCLDSEPGKGSRFCVQLPLATPAPQQPTPNSPTTMRKLIKIAQLQDVPPDHARPFTVEGQTIALFNVEGTYYAIGDTCTHEGGPLSDGEIQATKVTCPWHGAEFDLKTGAVLRAPAFEGVSSYRVVVEGSDIKVEV